jgi:hypothetical protein
MVAAARSVNTQSGGFTPNSHLSDKENSRESVEDARQSSSKQGEIAESSAIVRGTR